MGKLGKKRKAVLKAAIPSLIFIVKIAGTSFLGDYYGRNSGGSRENGQIYGLFAISVITTSIH